MAEPIVSLEKINHDALIAVNLSVPLKAANKYPKYSAASNAFIAAYTLAHAERCIEAA